MVNIGEWKVVKIGDVTAVGYVSNIINYSWIGDRVQLTKVGWLSNKGIEWWTPSIGTYEEGELRSADNLLNEYQDKTTLIDLALLTKDKQWFEELTRGK